MSKSWKWLYLRDLTQKLSANEKRYISLYNQIEKQDKPSNRIFTWLQENKDVEFIKSQFASKEVNLSYEKSQLIKTIFRSLRNFHEESSTTIEFANALINIELLMNKQIYDFCMDYLDYYIDLAQESEQFEYKMIFLKWKRKCWSRVKTKNIYQNQLSREFQEEINCMKSLNNIYEIIKINQRAFALSKTYSRGIPEKMKAEFKKILLENQSVSPITSYAKLFSLDTEYQYETHVPVDYEKGYAIAVEMIKTLEENESIFRFNPQVYFSIYTNLYCSLGNAGKDASYILDHLDSKFRIKDEKIPYDLRLQVFIFVSESRLIDLHDKGDLTEAILLYNQVKKLVNKIGRQNFILDYLMCIDFISANSHFRMGDYENAYRITKRILDEIPPEIRLDIYHFAKIQYILIHFINGNYSVLEHLSQSLERFEKKHDIDTSVSKQILNCIRDWEGAKTLSQNGNWKEKYLKIFTQLSTKNDYSKVMLEITDMIKLVKDNLVGRVSP